jgi:hypothetical protein
MKKEELLRFIKSPGSLRESDVPGIDEMLRLFPFFSTLHILKAKAYHNSDSPLYEVALKRAALQASNRKALQKLITEIAVQDAIHIAETKAVVVEEKIAPVEVNIVEEIPEPKSLEPTAPEIMEEIPVVKVPELPVIAQPPKEIVGPNTEPSQTQEKSFLAWLQATSPSLQSKSDKKNIIRLDTSEEIKPLMADAIGELILGNVFNEGYLIKADQPGPRSNNSPQAHLIEEFINLGHPKVIKVNKDQPVANLENKARKSADEADVPVSETLADIFVKQKLFGKAIAAYEKLSLKYPDKKLYFASLIEKLNKEIN